MGNIFSPENESPAPDGKRKLPPNCKEIIKTYLELDPSPPDWEAKIYTGLYSQNKTKRYWVDKETSSHCFMLYARELNIVWGDDDRYWNWKQEKEDKSAVVVDVNELKRVCWLSVKGEFDAELLSAGTMYELVLVLKVTDKADNLEVPVKLGLTPPKGEKQTSTKNLMELEKNQWKDVKLGEFKASSGKVKFELYDYRSSWKSGLVIKGCQIRPKKQSK